MRGTVGDLAEGPETHPGFYGVKERWHPWPRSWTGPARKWGKSHNLWGAWDVLRLPHLGGGGSSSQPALGYVELWVNCSHDHLVCVELVLSRKVCGPTVGRQALPLQVPTLGDSVVATPHRKHTAWLGGLESGVRPCSAGLGLLDPHALAWRGPHVSQGAHEDHECLHALHPESDQTRHICPALTPVSQPHPWPGPITCLLVLCWASPCPALPFLHPVPPSLKSSQVFSPQACPSKAPVLPAFLWGGLWPRGIVDFFLPLPAPPGPPPLVLPVPWHVLTTHRVPDSGLSPTSSKLLPWSEPQYTPHFRGCWVGLGEAEPWAQDYTGIQWQLRLEPGPA